ncbi:MAG: hypothetical protein C0412_15270 [Flavobacterium sp.]|nr:hypothetical protein [Flavobacterium sp.]
MINISANTASKSNLLTKLLLMLFFFIYTQNIAQEIRFKNLSAENGLSHNSVTAFCQDKSGFIWIGTADGLNKFDGKRFIVYRNSPNDSTSLSDNSILSIFEDSEGILWIGTENGGLNRFNPKTEIFGHFINSSSDKNSIPNNHVSSILSDKYGNIWFGTRKGLCVLPVSEKNKIKSNFKSFFNDGKNPNSITDNEIYSIYFDSEGRLWLSLSNNFGADCLTFSGMDITKFSKRNFQTDPKNNNSLSSSWVLYIFEDSKKRIWISTWAYGLTKYEPSKNKFTRYRFDMNNHRSISGNNIEMVLEDNQGAIWVATYGGGLNKYIEESNSQPGHFISYKFNSIDPLSISDNRVTILFKEKTGMIWIGTAGHGFSRFNPHSLFENIQLNDIGSSIDYSPSAMIKTSNGDFWAGTAEGVLFRIRKNSNKTDRFTFSYDGKPVRNYPIISSLFEDEEGTLWMTTTRGGVYYSLKGSHSSPKPEFFNAPPPKSKDPIKYLKGYWIVRENSFKDLIFGTYNENSMQILSRRNKLKKNFNFDFTPMSPFMWSFINMGEYAWIGTYANGVFKVDFKNRKVLNHLFLKPKDPYSKYNIPNNDVYAILQSSDNSIWFGTMKSLSRMLPETDTLIHYRYKDGLCNETVYGILEDNNKNLWISTYNGLAKYDINTNIFTNFYREDGIQGNEFNQFSYYKDKEGFLYFGGTGGITVVKPERENSKMTFPEIKITGLHLNNMLLDNKSLIKEGITSESISFTKVITLPYNKEAFSIEFSALEYNSPQKIRYQYILDGYMENWTNISSNHIATFMNLEPKTYILKVKSTNKDGVWNPAGIELKIIIKPPFWKTAWFEVFLFLFTAGIIFLFYQWRILAHKKQQKKLEDLVLEQTMQLRERNADLESFSYSVSHDLRAPLRSIYSFSQIIKDDFGHQLSEEAKFYFDKITSAAYNMTGLIEGILKLTKIARAEIRKENINISEIAENTIRILKIEFTNKNIISKIEPDIFVNGDFILITTVFENLLSNALKFSMMQDEIKIEVGKTKAFERTRTNASEVIYVKDNGIGFDMRYSEKLFQVFQRLHDQKEFEGSGIGLANVKKIINRHGGVIWAESEIGKGAAFYFTLEC